VKSKLVVRVLIASVLACAALSGTTLAESSSRDQLRFIVQELCLKHWRLTHEPAPCMRLAVNGDGSDPQGFAVLADRKGGAHLLLIPIATISGIESGVVRVPNSFNFFDAAWRARDALASTIGTKPPRAAVGLAVNPLQSRSQDQLHIHIACLSPLVYRALQTNAANIGTNWSVVRIGPAHYQALRVMGSNLGQHNPFELLATHVAAHDDAAMGRYTLLVAGMSFKEGPGFILLAGGEGVPPAELLIDGSCAVLHRYSFQPDS
jgi:CDP-diacylglycerol pyrophosphatase